MADQEQHTSTEGADPERALTESPDLQVGARERGVDAEASQRPGVPMESEVAPAEGAPERIVHQTSVERHFRRAGLDDLTAVYGTAQPPHGVSGQIRRSAYGIPEHRARHWALLMLADRVDVLESRLGRALGSAARSVGAADGTARKLERNALPILLGVVVGTALVTRMARR
ncbi:MAG: hypothetical protein R3E98_16585 [Gemmatimonadota bacterium]|nr:hypothetical protein [Gemmatimonadota bacterium]